MAFQIPPSAFLSFSYKQTLDSFYRLLAQMDAQKESSPGYLENLKALKTYIEICADHESQKITSLARELSQLVSGPLEKRTIDSALSLLERKLGYDVTEDEFLISTEDTPQMKAYPKREIHLILDNLRSSFNVGSLFRSAEAFGATTIHLCGYTATPENSKTTKSALGADNWVEWKYFENTLECIEDLKANGFALFALETTQESQSLYDLNNNLPMKIAIILGNERYGLAQPILKRADFLVSIPLFGRKNSLNVGVCGAIALNGLRSLERD